MIVGAITQSKWLRLADRLFGAVVTIVLVVFLTIPSTSADACPPDKASNPAISSVHQNTIHKTEHKVFVTAAPLVLKHDFIHTAVRCCGGVQHGGGCSTGHCSSCLTAVVIPTSEEMLTSVAMILGLPGSSTLIGLDSTADFRPPRLGA